MTGGLLDNSLRGDTGARHVHKYTNKNPFQRFALGRFFDVVADELAALAPGARSPAAPSSDAPLPFETLEFGCGEGLFLERLHQRGVRFSSLVGIDLRQQAITEARRRCPAYDFRVQDLTTWDVPPESFDLVIASQVLEHLPDCGVYLRRLVELCRGHLLLTVRF